MWRYHMGVPVKKDGVVTKERCKSPHWMPTPIKGLPLSSRAVFATKDVISLSLQAHHPIHHRRASP
jgi:hypothetical protein